MFALAIPIAVIILAIWLQASNQAAKTTAEAIISWLVHVAHVEILGIKVNLGSVVGSAAVVVQKLTDYFTFAFGSLFAAQERAAVSWISGLQTYLDFITSRTFAPSFTMQRLAHWLVHVHIPAYVKSHAVATAGAVTNITKIVRTFPQTVVHVTKVVRVYAHGEVVKGQKLITEASAAKVLALVPRVEKLYAKTEADLKALTKIVVHGKSLAVTRTAAATVAIGLAAIGSSWIRCNKVGRLGKALCGGPAAILDDLLPLLTDFLVLRSICQVLPLLDEGFGLAEPFIADFTSGIASAACRGAFAASPALSIPALQLPSGASGVIPVLQLV